MQNQKTLDISIIIACRNEEAHIEEFVESLVGQAMGHLSWEAIIADGMSTDATPTLLAELSAKYPNLKVIPNPGRTVSKGLNAAIRMARGQYILRMDAHTIYSSTYCMDCVTTLESTGADNAGGPARTRVEGLEASAIAAAYHSPFSTGGAKFHDPSYEGWVDTVTYGCWRREVFERIGMFDEALARNQDDEFNLRLVRAGGKIWQSPFIVSWYTPRSTISSLFHQYFQYGFWKVFVIRKHRMPGSWRHLVPAMFVLTMAVLPLIAAVSALVGPETLSVALTMCWIALLLTYVSANLVASVITANSNHNWRMLPLLPVAYAAFHFSYGSGFLMALIQSSIQGKPKASGDSVFARITR